MCSLELCSVSPAGCSAWCSCDDTMAGGAGAGALWDLTHRSGRRVSGKGCTALSFPTGGPGGYLLVFPALVSLLSNVLSSLQLSCWTQRNRKRSWAGPPTRQTG